MKRAVIKQTAVTVRPASQKPVRFCARVGCGNELSPKRKKFCSHTCQAIFMSGGNGGGVEEKYKKEYATTKLKEYMDDCKKADERTLIPTSNSYIVLNESGLPTQEDFADFLMVHPDTLVNWAKKHLEFAQALDYLKRQQKKWLMRNGLSGRYSPVIAKLILGAEHGMIERKEVDNTHRLLGFVKHTYEAADQLGQGK